jgi:hypothetical protein
MDAEDWKDVMDENLPKKICVVDLVLMWQLVVMTQTAVVMFS